MTYRVACADADGSRRSSASLARRFAKSTDCRPTSPVAVAQIHGTADDTVSFTGGRLEGFSSILSAYPGAEKTAATWARYDGCAAAAPSADQRIDVDADLADGGRPAETTVKRWSGCKPGGAVELWTIQGGNHEPRLRTTFPRRSSTSSRRTQSRSPRSSP